MKSVREKRNVKNVDDIHTREILFLNMFDAAQRVSIRENCLPMFSTFAEIISPILERKCSRRIFIDVSINRKGRICTER